MLDYNNIMFLYGMQITVFICTIRMVDDLSVISQSALEMLGGAFWIRHSGEGT